MKPKQKLSGVRQVRQPRQQDRRSPKLERAGDAAEPYWQSVPLMARWRVDLIRGCAEYLGTVEAANDSQD
jgi:hypothetical protein